MPQIERSTKVCTVCHLELPADHFYADPRKRDGLRARCRSCENRKQVEYQRRYAKTPAGQLNQWRGNLARRGLTPETYEQLRAAQGGVCAICGRPEFKKASNGGGSVRRLAVDHCHRTGKVRGLLCNNCNVGIGHFEEQLDVMAAAMTYLRERT